MEQTSVEYSDYYPAAIYDIYVITDQLASSVMASVMFKLIIILSAELHRN